MNILLRRRLLGNTSCRAIEANSQTGLKAMRNDSREADGPFGTVFRWGCTSDVDAEMIVNPVNGIHLVTNKFKTRKVILAADVRIPRTFEDAASAIEANCPHGVIIRPLIHHQGRRLVHTKSPHEIRQAARAFDPSYISEYLPKEREFRVYVIQGRVVAVAEKFVEDQRQVAWNHYLGGEFRNVKWNGWPIEACQDAIKAIKAVGLDFGGVDIIQYRDVPFTLEVNSAPSLTSDYRQKVFARAFDCIVRNGKDEIPLNGRPSTWRDVIHPAVH